jgi:hypothetical protein
MGSRGAISRSTPPKGSNRLRIASARFKGRFGSSARAEVRTRRASSSIDLPWRAARTRSRAFTTSSRRRIVMLAICQ